MKQSKRQAGGVGAGSAPDRPDPKAHEKEFTGQSRGCLKKDFVASVSGFSSSKADVQIATQAWLGQVEERFLTANAGAEKTSRAQQKPLF